MATLCAFALIIDEQSRVLLCRRRKDRKWNLPGGHADPAEAPWNAVVREVREEVGVEVRVLGVRGLYHIRSKDDLVLTFACSVPTEAVQVGEEIEDAGWFNMSRLPSDMRERHAGLVIDAFQGGEVVIRSEG
jgi:8-oxo-dGTP pyrophosphatase MutT (NUDIX family)